MGLRLSPQANLTEVVIWLVHPALQSALELGRDCWKNCMRYAFVHNVYASKPLENEHP